MTAEEWAKAEIGYCDGCGRYEPVLAQHGVAGWPERCRWCAEFRVDSAGSGTPEHVILRALSIATTEILARLPPAFPATREGNEAPAEEPPGVDMGRGALPRS